LVSSCTAVAATLVEEAPATANIFEEVASELLAADAAATNTTAQMPAVIKDDAEATKSIFDEVAADLTPDLPAMAMASEAALPEEDEHEDSTFAEMAAEEALQWEPILPKLEFPKLQFEWMSDEGDAAVPEAESSAEAASTSAPDRASARFQVEELATKLATTKEAYENDAVMFRQRAADMIPSGTSDASSSASSGSVVLLEPVAPEEVQGQSLVGRQHGAFLAPGATLSTQVLHRHLPMTVGTGVLAVSAALLLLVRRVGSPRSFFLRYSAPSEFSMVVFDDEDYIE